MKKLLFIILALLIAFPVLGAEQWDKNIPTGETEINDYDVVFPTNFEALDRVLSGYREGVKISYSSTSAVSVGAGEIVCSNADGSVRRLRKNTGATTVSFTSLDTGSEEASKTYYIYATADTDIEGFLFKISLSSTAPTGVTYYKRLGSFYNDASKNITEISNDNLSSNYYDSGWFAVSTGTLYTKTHNLMKDDLLVTIYASNTSDGSGTVVQLTVDMHNDESNATEGGGLVGLTNSTAKMYWLNSLYRGPNVSGSAVEWTSGYARIIILALD